MLSRVHTDRFDRWRNMAASLETWRTVAYFPNNDSGTPGNRFAQIPAAADS